MNLIIILSVGTQLTQIIEMSQRTLITETPTLNLNHQLIHQKMKYDMMDHPRFTSKQLARKLKGDIRSDQNLKMEKFLLDPSFTTEMDLIPMPINLDLDNLELDYELQLQNGYQRKCSFFLFQSGNVGKKYRNFDT